MKMADEESAKKRNYDVIGFFNATMKGVTPSMYKKDPNLLLVWDSETGVLKKVEIMNDGRPS